MTDAPLPAQPSDSLLAISADMLVAGTHFVPKALPTDLAWKCLAVNLSDLASMGATPSSVSLVLGTAPGEKDWQQTFLEAFQSQCQEHALMLSSVSCVTGPKHISIQIIGWVPQSQTLRRDGAKAGDDVYVSGTLGAAGLGLQLLLGKRILSDDAAHSHCLTRLNRPTPRIALGQALLGISRCAIDISDGLSGDLLHICERSQVGMHIESPLLPVSAAVREHCLPDEALALALSAGDDYELAFTAPPGAGAELMRIAEQLHLPVTRIGRVEIHSGLRISDAQGQDLMPAPAYEHFRTVPEASEP